MARFALNRRRTWLALLAVTVLAVLVALAALPWALSTAPARRWLLARADRALAPGRLELDGLRFSWFGPTRLVGFRLRDAAGDRVVDAPRATWDRTLGQVLFDRPRYGTLTLDGAAVDVERTADGSIDLYETLRPILKADPRTDLTVRIQRSTFRLRSPGLAQPVTARRLDLTLHRPPAPGWMVWLLDLRQGDGDAPGLEVRGEYNNGHGEQYQTPALSIRVRGRDWPLAIDAGGVAVEARFRGLASLTRMAGRWDSWGRAELAAIAAQGPALRGDRLRLDRVDGGWNVRRFPGRWEVTKLDLSSPIGNLTATGNLPPGGGPSRIEGHLDLAALARQLPHTLHLREGLRIEKADAQLAIDLNNRPDQPRARVDASLPELEARLDDRNIHLSEPLRLSARLGAGGRVDAFGLDAPALHVEGHGDLDAGLDLNGRLDLAGLRRQLRDLVDLGDLTLEGSARLAAHYQRKGANFSGRLEVTGEGLAVGGPVTLRPDDAHLTVSIDGPASSTGLPSGWARAVAHYEGGGLTADLAGDAATLEAGARGTVADARAEGKLSGRWADGGLAIDAARLAVRPPGDGASIEIAARGRYDRARGELVLLPAEDARDSAVALAPDGLRVVGLNTRGNGLRADLALAGSLAALDRTRAAWAGVEPGEPLAGDWSARATVQAGDGLQFGARVEARPGGSALAVGLRGAYHADADRLDLTELALSTPYATAEAAGRIENLRRGATFELDGTLRPDWPRLNALARERVEPGARIAGQAGRIRVRGPLKGDGIEAEAGFTLDAADLYGLKLGRAAVAVRFAKGGLLIDPIEATLNGGTLRLDPSVGREDGRLTLNLGEGTRLQDAEINDEVSRRVLSFVAPVLDRATRVHGFVSARIDHAAFPLAADAGRKAEVQGQVVFQDVEFAPGPLGTSLLDLVGRGDATIALDQPVHLSIADGKVHQSGLALPIGRLTAIELEGDVGFDRSLDLVASLPLTPAMVANNPLLGDIVGGARVRVPIGGTLSQPRVDREAFNLAMKGLGRDLLMRGAAAGAGALLERLSRPRDMAPRFDDPPPDRPGRGRGLFQRRRRR